MPRTKAARPTITNKQTDVQGELEGTIKTIHDLRDTLSRLQPGDFLKLPATRKLKVHKHLRTNGRNPTTACPEIILRGNWLEEAGFNCDDQWVYVIAANGMMIIAPEKKKNRPPNPLK